MGNAYNDSGFREDDPYNTAPVRSYYGPAPILDPAHECPNSVPAPTPPAAMASTREQDLKDLEIALMIVKKMREAEAAPSPTPVVKPATMAPASSSYSAQVMPPASASVLVPAPPKVASVDPKAQVAASGLTDIEREPTRLDQLVSKVFVDPYDYATFPERPRAELEMALYSKTTHGFHTSKLLLFERRSADENMWIWSPVYNHEMPGRVYLQGPNVNFGKLLQDGYTRSRQPNYPFMRIGGVSLDTIKRFAVIIAASVDNGPSSSFYQRQMAADFAQMLFHALRTYYGKDKLPGVRAEDLETQAIMSESPFMPSILPPRAHCSYKETPDTDFRHQRFNVLEKYISFDRTSLDKRLQLPRSDIIMFDHYERATNTGKIYFVYDATVPCQTRPGETTTVKRYFSLGFFFNEGRGPGTGQVLEIEEEVEPKITNINKATSLQGISLFNILEVALVLFNTRSTDKANIDRAKAYNVFATIFGTKPMKLDQINLLYRQLGAPVPLATITNDSHYLPSVIPSRSS